MSPADAARKKTIHNRQNTARRRSASSGVTDPVAVAMVTPERVISQALIDPAMASTAASPASVARTPNARRDQPKRGAAIIAPAGYRLTIYPLTRPLTFENGLIHHLLHDDVGGTTTDAEEQPVPDGELA